LANEPVIPVNEWDNHEVHLMVIENYMKGQEYETLDPAIQKEFQLHRQKHKDHLVQVQFQQMMQAAGGDPNADPNANPNAQGQPGDNQFSGIEQPPALDSQNPLQ